MGFKPLIPPPYSTAFWAKHPELGYTAVPNSKWSFLAADSRDIEGDRPNTVLKIGSANALGFRPVVTNGDCPVCPAIIALGDSITFGAEVNDDESWPEFASQIMTKHGATYRFHNFAMRGYSALQSYFALRVALENTDKVENVLYMFVANDPRENFMTDQRPRPYLNSSLAISEPIERDEWELAFKENAHLGRYTSVKYRMSLMSLAHRIRNGPSYQNGGRFPHIDTCRGKYLDYWREFTGPGLRSMLLEFLDSDKSQLQQRGMRRALGLMAEECHQRDIHFFVAFAPFGPMSNGRDASELANALSMSEEQFASFLNMYRRAGEVIADLTLDVGGTFLEISPTLFSQMSYREYTATPENWHYSVAASQKVGEEIGRELILALHKMTNGPGVSP